MSIPRNIAVFLDKTKFVFAQIEHDKAYTAKGLAAKINCSQDKLVKNIIVRMDGELAMVLLPASEKIDIQMLREEINIHNIKLLTEREMRKEFPEYDLGEVPPFASINKCKLYLSDHLLRSDTLYFNVGSYTDAISCKTRDYIKLEHPVIVNFSEKYNEYNDVRWHL